MMASLPSWLRTIGFVGSIALSVQGAIAADYLKFPVEPAPDYIGKPVELGSGWYLRGDLGWSSDNGPQLSSFQSEGKQNRWALDVGAGYKFNNWLRTDATLTFSKPRDVSKNGSVVTCPYVLYGLTNQRTNEKDGFLWDAIHDTCNSQDRADLRKTDLMLNAYVDLGSWKGFTPFVGVGAGVSMLKYSETLKYTKTSDGSAYAADLSAAAEYPHIWVDAYGKQITSWTDAAGVVHAGEPPVPFAKQSFDRQANKTKFNLAWSLMGGVAYDITPQLKSEISYRYLNSGAHQSLSSPLSTSVKSNIDSHQIRLGLRYMVD